MELTLHIHNERPFFAEVPYYLWGEVNYDSDGDCKHPTDQSWTFLYLQNRETRESIDISGEGHVFSIYSENEDLVIKAALFLVERCKAEEVSTLHSPTGWNHAEAMRRTEKIRMDFENLLLKPFDHMLFWGSWKWTGKFATDFTWVGRWIMNALLQKDTRAVHLCAWWLREGTGNEIQSKALRYALSYLTQKGFESDSEWVNWYFGESESAKGEGEQLFPEPDFQQWKDEP